MKFLHLLFTTLVLSVATFAQVKLSPLFTNNMVLQQQTKAAIWGWTSPAKTVTVTPSWNKKHTSVKAGADGKWKASLETPAAGCPYEIKVSDGRIITLTNVMIGEVWLLCRPCF